MKNEQEKESVKGQEKTGYLEITLHSPLCASIGQGYGGLVDIEVAQEFGLPIIPAKRLKGCLEAAGKELAAYDETLTPRLNRLFGLPGDKQGGALQIGDAHLYKIPWTFLDQGKDPEAESHHTNALQTQNKIRKTPLKIKNYVGMLRQLKKEINDKRLHPQDVLALFTSLRTRSAVDPQTGSTRETALYTMRTVHKGLVFRSFLTLRGSEDELWKTLQICAKALRQIGMSVTRGFGEVRCTVGREKQKFEKSALPQRSSQDEQGICTYTIESLTPLLLPGQHSFYGSAGDYISGRTLLGALAGLFIADRGLEKEMHKADFRRIFLRGEVKFGYAFPAVDGKTPFFPCPAVLQREKMTGKYHHAAYPAEKGMQLRSERRPVQIHAGSVTVLEVEKEVRLHHARPLDGGIGRALGETGPGSPAENGQLYQYAAISAGQYFTGTIEGKQSDLELLKACVKRRNGRLQIGRSRTAEYGQAQLNVQPFQPLCSQKKFFSPGENMVLWLVSPLVLLDAQGRDSLDPQLLIGQINTQGQGEWTLHLEQSFLRFARLGGYQTKWQLPRQQRIALDAGTALWVKVAAGSQSGLDLGFLEDTAWGESTGEGCGRIKILSGEAIPTEKKAFQGILAAASQTIEAPCGENNGKEESELIDILRRHKAVLDKLQEQKKNALRVAMKKQEFGLELSTIEQLQRIFYLKKKSYVEFIKEVDKIKNEKKKECIKQFITPCEEAASHLIASLREKGFCFAETDVKEFKRYFISGKQAYLEGLREDNKTPQESARAAQVFEEAHKDLFQRQISVFAEWYLKRAKWQARRQSNATAEK